MTSTRVREMFAAHFAMTRAIDAVWRRIARSTEPEIALGPIVDGIMAKCGFSSKAARAEVRYELQRRLSRYRPRRRREKASTRQTQND